MTYSLAYTIAIFLILFVAFAVYSFEDEWTDAKFWRQVDPDLSYFRALINAACKSSASAAIVSTCICAVGWIAIGAFFLVLAAIRTIWS